MTSENEIDIVEYVKHGWKMLSPKIAVCSECHKPMLSNAYYDYYYCATCYRRQSAAAEQPKPSRIPELLLQHYCMLNDVCPTPGCLNPLLRSPDKSCVVCGVCGYQAEYQESKRASEPFPAAYLAQQIVERTDYYIKRMENGEFEEPFEAEEAAEQRLKKKMNVLIDELLESQDYEHIRVVADNILRLQQIIKNLQNL